MSKFGELECPFRPDPVACVGDPVGLLPGPPGTATPDRPHGAGSGEPEREPHRTIKTEVRDPLAVAAACRRLGLPEPAQGTARLFSGEATGLLVRLPGWLYAAVVDTATGQVRFDNYCGRVGPARTPRQVPASLRAGEGPP